MDKYLSDRAISENLLLEKLSRMIDYCQKDKSVNAINALFQMGDAIMDCPTVDTVPVVHGQWKWRPILVQQAPDMGDDWEEKEELYCTACGKAELYEHKSEYCPNCGAKMFSE